MRWARLVVNSRSGRQFLSLPLRIRCFLTDELTFRSCIATRILMTLLSIISGEISGGDGIMLSDAERFKAIVPHQINQGHLVHGVRTYSPGGDAYAALSIGRQIRTLGLMTSAPLNIL